MNFLEYLKNLNHEDWDKQVTEKWTVKDVVAHMVGWERGDVEEIRRIWETKSPPWWKNNPNYDEFNDKWISFYKNYSPEELIAEWEMWQKKVEEEVDKIGYENIKARTDLFDWLLQDGGEYTLNEGGSHYDHHLKQIKEALGK